MCLFLDPKVSKRGGVHMTSSCKGMQTTESCILFSLLLYDAENNAELVRLMKDQMMY
jgi:hypothetical protein